MKRRLKPIIVAGHAGMVNGYYETPGKRSDNGPKGIFYEGAGNRWMKWRIKEDLDRRGVPYYDGNPADEDTSLLKRVNLTNRIYRDEWDVYALELHHNAGGGIGTEGFTTPGETRSDPISEMFLLAIENAFPERRMRFDKSDGDRDKEKRFYYIRNTFCPAFLLEWAFMDHPDDYEVCWSPEYLARIVTVLCDVIERIWLEGV